MGSLPRKRTVAGRRKKLPKAPPPQHKERSQAVKIYKGRWRRYSEVFRMKNPWCVKCGRLGDHVDHIVPYKEGDDFWDPDNHQTLCRSCHGIKTSKEQRNPY